MTSVFHDRGSYVENVVAASAYPPRLHAQAELIGTITAPATALRPFPDASPGTGSIGSGRTYFAPRILRMNRCADLTSLAYSSRCDSRYLAPLIGVRSGRATGATS